MGLFVIISKITRIVMIKQNHFIVIIISADPNNLNRFSDLAPLYLYTHATLGLRLPFSRYHNERVKKYET